MFGDEKPKSKTGKNNMINIGNKKFEIEEEINTKKKIKDENKKMEEEDVFEEKKKESDDDDDLKVKNQKEDIKPINKIIEDDEQELNRIDLPKNIVVRILLISGEKYIDFCKFYKGYPTKKFIRIKYKNYIKLNNLLLNDSI